MAKNAIRNFLKKLKAMDEVPEQIVDAACEMADEAVEEEKEEMKIQDEDEKKTEDDVPEVASEVSVSSKAPAIETIVADAVSRALMKYGVIRDEAMENLDACTEDADGEEEVTVDPEEIKDEETVKEIVKDVKPYIAGIKDSAVRKKIADSVAKLAKRNRQTTSGYGFIQQAVGNNRKQMMSDSAIPEVDDYGVGMDIASKYNPHYKKEEK